MLMTIRGGECGLRSHRRLEEALRLYGGARGDGKEGTRRLRRSRSNDRLRRETREGGGYHGRMLGRLRREARGVLEGVEKVGTELSDSVRSLVEVEERRGLSSERYMTQSTVNGELRGGMTSAPRGSNACDDLNFAAVSSADLVHATFSARR